MQTLSLRWAAREIMEYARNLVHEKLLHESGGVDEEAGGVDDEQKVWCLFTTTEMLVSWWSWAKYSTNHSAADESKRGKPGTTFSWHISTRRGIFLTSSALKNFRGLSLVRRQLGHVFHASDVDLAMLFDESWLEG
jgi:hypothetical protein